MCCGSDSKTHDDAKRGRTSRLHSGNTLTDTRGHGSIPEQADGRTCRSVRKQDSGEGV